MFKFKYLDKTYTLIQIIRVRETGFDIIAFDEDGKTKVFDKWDLENRFTFLDPEITNSPLYKAMQEKESV